MKKNIKLVFENQIQTDEGLVFIPNGMSTYLTNKMIEHLILNNETRTVNFKKFLSENNTSIFPYDTRCPIFESTNKKLLSEITYNDDDYYLYHINTSGNFKCGLTPQLVEPGSIIKTSYFENLSNEIINYLQTKSNFFIYIVNQQESIDFDILEQIYHQTKKYNIPLEKIIVQTDCANYNDIKNIIENEYKINFNMKYMMYPWYFVDGADDMLLNIERIAEFSDFKKNRQNKVLCLNRRLKEYRIATISFLLAMDYDGMYLSYYENLGTDNSFIEKLSHKKEKEFKELQNTLYRGYEVFKKTKNRQVDKVTDLTHHNPWIIDKRFYTDSYFSLVTETCFNENLRITEKIVKPIINYHPFVIVGSPGCLDLLKFYGFKTFSDFWDESYDTIKNPYDRFLEITKLIDYLMNLKIQEWDDITEKLKPILIHNREHLKKFKASNSKQNFIENFYNLLENKLNNKYNSILCLE